MNQLNIFIKGTGTTKMVKADRSTNCTWISVLNYNWPKGRYGLRKLEEELDNNAVFH
jgi:hypothetical protein